MGDHARLRSDATWPPANRGCRSPCRPVVASVAAKVSSAGNRAWLGNGCRTAARLRVGPPPRPCRTARHSLGHRLAFASGAGPAMGMVAGPEAPRTARPAMRQPPPLHANRRCIGLICPPHRKVISVAGQPVEIAAWQGTREMGFNSSYLDALHRRRTAAVWETLGTRISSTAAACRDQRVSRYQLLHGVLLQLGLGQQPL